MKTFTVTPEEFANGQAHIKALDLCRTPRGPHKPRVLPKRASLDRQIGTVNPEQFATGDVYKGQRRFGHRLAPAPVKPLPESLLEALLPDLLLDLHAQYGSAFPRPAGSIIQFTVVDEQTTYKKAEKKITNILSSHGLLPAMLDIAPKVPGPTNYQIVIRIQRGLLM